MGVEGVSLATISQVLHFIILLVFYGWFFYVKIKPRNIFKPSTSLSQEDVISIRFLQQLFRYVLQLLAINQYSSKNTLVRILLLYSLRCCQCFDF